MAAPVHHATVHLVNDNAPVDLGNRFRFERIVTRSQRLPPRGLLRMIEATVTSRDCIRYEGSTHHTLFFTGLLASPCYQEMVVTHYALPAAGLHGPFITADLSPADFVPITPAELIERSTEHLRYRRLGCAPVSPRVGAQVLDLMSRVAARDATLFVLAAGDWFSAANNRRFPHEWSHALLEFHEYLVFEPHANRLLIAMFAFD